MKKIIFSGHKVKILKLAYNNGNVALEATCINGQPFATLTVNLVNAITPKGYAFIDTNNHPTAVEILTKEGIIEQGRIGTSQSGFCTYPLHKILI